MLQAIKLELEFRKNELIGEKIETIYFGGGTPSILTAKELEALFNVIYTNYDVVENAEITLEANPDDLTNEKIKELAKLPINRLSIGIQSFFEEDLKFMNRAHTAEESKKCLAEARKYFDNITIDLIYGIPGMSAEKWKSNLKTAFDFGVPHISSYALTVEEKTALHHLIKKGKISPIDEELALEHFNILVNETEKKGFVQYEISNFGKSGYFSKHNISYWKGEQYIGIGPSAHSYDGKKRGWNITNNAKYIKAITTNNLPIEYEILTKENQFNEYVMTGLRTIWGVSIKKITNDFGEDYTKELLKNAQKFINTDLLEIISNNNATEILVTTKKGKFLADGIASSLFIIKA